MNTIYKLYNMRFTKCTKDEYVAIGEGNYSKNTQYIVENPNGQMELYLGDKNLVSENNYTDSDKQKVDFLPNSTTQNDFNKAFQANWNETNTNSPSYIQNKPAFSSNGIDINGTIQSTERNTIFKSTDYSIDDLTNIDEYMGHSVSQSSPGIKYDFYLDGMIETEDKNILNKLVNGIWKQCKSSSTSYILGHGAYKNRQLTEISYIPTNVYEYNPATNNWDSKLNSNNTEFKVYRFDRYLQKSSMYNVNFKYAHAYEYNAADLNRIQNIIDNIGDKPTQDDYLKYDLNMDGLIDEIDKSLVEKFIPSITGLDTYWEDVIISRSYIFGSLANNNYNSIVYTTASLQYKQHGVSQYKTFSGDIGNNKYKQILTVTDLNVPNINAIDVIKSPKGQITNIEATSVSAKSVNVTDVSATSVDSSKLVLPNKSNTKQIINKIDSTANDINKLTASDNNSIPTSFAIKDFVSKSSVVQVNSDWNETDENSKAFIKNKPDLDAYVKQDQLTPVTTDLFVLKDKINSSLDFKIFPNGPEADLLKVNDVISIDSYKSRTVLVSGLIGFELFTCVCGVQNAYSPMNGQLREIIISGNAVTTNALLDETGNTIEPPSKYYNALFNLHLDSTGKVLGIFSKVFENGTAVNINFEITNITGLVSEEQPPEDES